MPAPLDAQVRLRGLEKCHRLSSSSELWEPLPAKFRPPPPPSDFEPRFLGDLPSGLQAPCSAPPCRPRSFSERAPALESFAGQAGRARCRRSLDCVGALIESAAAAAIRLRYMHVARPACQRVPASHSVFACMSHHPPSSWPETHRFLLSRSTAHARMSRRRRFDSPRRCGNALRESSLGAPRGLASMCSSRRGDGSGRGGVSQRSAS